tara:strand:- start:672 stop:1067 length:396 start_codon:yes stop_codon:yes gene_type:complete
MTALLLRAVIPVGFMPASLADGRGMMLCGGDPYSRALAALSSPAVPPMSMHHHEGMSAQVDAQSEHPASHAAFDHLCDFNLSGSADALTVIAYSTTGAMGRAVNFSGHQYLATQHSGRLRPPPRGPPRTTV